MSSPDLSLSVNSLYELSIYAFNLKSNTTPKSSTIKKITAVAAHFVGKSERENTPLSGLDQIALEILRKRFPWYELQALPKNTTLAKTYNKSLEIMIDNYYLQGFDPEIELKGYYNTFSDMLEVFLRREKNPEKRFDFAKICARIKPRDTGNYFKSFCIVDSQQQFEIAKLCGGNLVEFIGNFNITDPDQRFELAKLCAGDFRILSVISQFELKESHSAEIACLFLKNNNSNVTLHDFNFKNFKIADPELQYKIALAAVGSFGLDLPSNFKMFDKITDEDHIFEIAKKCTETYSGALSLQQAFKNFVISDENRRLELLKKCLEKTKVLDCRHSGTAYYIQDFNIQSPTEFLEIVKECAQQDGAATAKCFKRYGIEDPLQQYQIAKLCVKHGKAEVVKELLENFVVENFTSKQRFKIALLAAEKDGETISVTIKNWDIEDPDQLFMIAKACAKQNGVKTAENFKNFDINDPKRCFKIAKLAALQGGGVRENFSQFEITKPNLILELVKMCARNDGVLVAKLFPTFNITAPEQVFEIAKLCIQQRGAAVGVHIQNFGITDPDRRFDLFRMCAKSFQGLTPAAAVFENFEITDPEKCFEAAKWCAEQSTKCTIENLEKFMLQTAEQLYQFAEICFETFPAAALHCFSKFESFTLLQKIQLAKISARVDANDTLQCFYKFDIKNIEIIFEIVKICAENNAEDTAKFFRTLSLTPPNVFSYKLPPSPLNPAQRFTIARICAHGSAYDAMSNIRNFDLEEEAALEIFRLALTEDPLGTLKSYSRFEEYFSNSELIVSMLNNTVIYELFRGNLEIAGYLKDLDNTNPLFEFLSKFETFTLNQLKEFISTLCPQESQFSHILANILSQTPEKHLKTHLFVFALMLFGFQNLKPEHLQWCEKNKDIQKDFKEIMDVRVPSLRPQLLKGMMIAIIGNTSKPIPGLAAFKSHYPLTMQAQLYNLLVRGQVLMSDVMQLHKMLSLREKKTIDDITSSTKLQAQSLTTSKLTGRKTAFLRDKLKTQILLKALVLLNEIPENHTDILKKILSENKTDTSPPNQEQILRNLYNLISIIEFGGIDQIVGDVKLEELSAHLFERKLFVSGFENISERFDRIFTDSRNPQAIRILAGKYASSGEEDLCRSLGDFIASVLKGTYEEDRNNPELDTHLTEIEKISPGIIQEWWSIPVEPVNVTETAETEPQKLSEEQLFQWMRDKLLVHHHLEALSQFPYLEGYLRGNLSLTLPIASSSSESPLEKLRREFQETCIACISSGTREELNGYLLKIKRIMRELHMESEEFMNDIGVFLDERVAEGKWRGVETTDPVDILLCGTEILGSCQRIDGAVQLNQGLEGYLKNGRTRMVAVKNIEVGVNRSRMMIKLFIDPIKNSPVMLLERAYPETISDEDKKVLITLAIRKAERRGITVVEKKGQGKKYPNPIISYPCRGVSDYSDAAGGVMKRGITTLSEDLTIVYEPSKVKRARKKMSL